MSELPTPGGFDFFTPSSPTKKASRFWRILLALDQLGNVVFFNGYEDETISSNAAKAARKGKRWGCVLCRVLHWVDRDHCERVIELDEGKPS